MRILVVTQYFWPENFKINDFVLGMKELGHTITVLTGKPNYPSGKYS
jgi:colanic acid biosynthesis glycosyl transferase WcaI